MKAAARQRTAETTRSNDETIVPVPSQTRKSESSCSRRDFLHYRVRGTVKPGPLAIPPGQESFGPAWTGSDVAENRLFRSAHQRALLGNMCEAEQQRHGARQVITVQGQSPHQFRQVLSDNYLWFGPPSISRRYSAMTCVGNPYVFSR